MRDASVEADACNVEEQSAVELTGIDSSFAATERDVDGAHRIEWNAQFPRETIAGSARNNGQRGIAKHQRRTDFVDGPVAAPGEDERRALRAQRRPARGRGPAVR